MPKYVIEREIPGAGNLKPRKNYGHLAEIVRRSEEHGATNPVG